MLIVDDNPAAEADEGDVGEGQTLEVDAASGLLANDIAGADGAEILGVRAVGENPSAPAIGGVGAVIVGLYGELTVAADGSYSYVANPNIVPPDGAEDVFVYTLADGDGDPSTTTLTIRLSDAGLSADTVLLQVNEAALPTGSNPDSDAETVFGDLNDNVAGGTGPFEFSLTGNGIGTHGTFTLNPDGTYFYTLTERVDGVTRQQWHQRRAGGRNLHLQCHRRFRECDAECDRHRRDRRCSGRAVGSRRSPWPKTPPRFRAIC